jgi:hypothetical protein
MTEMQITKIYHMKNADNFIAQMLTKNIAHERNADIALERARCAASRPGCRRSQGRHRRHFVFSIGVNFLVNAMSVINLHAYFTQWYKNKANQ